MAHHPTDRRNLADPDPNTPIDPTHKKHPTTTTTTTKPHLTHPDPTISSSSIQNISNHFAKLYSNHKVLASLKPYDGHSSQPLIDTHFQAKSMVISTIPEDSSTTSLTKSNFKHTKNVEKEATIAKVKEKEKRVSKKETRSNESHKRGNMKKTTSNLLMSRSQDGEVKGYIGGYEIKRPSLSLGMNGGGKRKSFCSSQVELADFFSSSGVKVVAVDMPPSMQIHAVDCARKTCDSLEKFTSKTLALTLKKEFDGVYGPAWHCIVGTSFGSFVTHSVGGFLYFSMDHKLYVLLFKTTVQRSD